MDENIAEIIIDPETKRITRVTFYPDNLRFRCRRCASFCCKLGGPQLTNTDVNRLEQAGHIQQDFLGSTSDAKYKGLQIMAGSLKNNNDGSCIFLKSDSKKGVYECLIYTSRPAICRLYPFDFERVSPNSLTLRIIPCCNGLNAEDGELLNEDFIKKHLLNPLLDLFV